MAMLQIDLNEPSVLYWAGCRCSSTVEQRFCKPPVMGSSPFTGSGNIATVGVPGGVARHARSG